MQTNPSSLQNSTYRDSLEFLWGWGYDYNNKNYNTPKIEIQKRYVRQYFDIQIGSFDNRNEIKWNIPISFFFVLKKRSGMPVNKGITG